MKVIILSCAAIIGITMGTLAEPALGDLVVDVNGKNVPPQFSGSLGLKEQFLTAGDYRFTLVNNAIGHSSYHPQASYTAWSYHTPGPQWGTNYNISFDDNDPTNDILDSNFIGPDRLSGGRFTNALNALESFEQTADADRLILEATILFDQTIGFYFGDQVISDNAGGVSVKIDLITVPEPSTLGILGAFGTGICFLRCRRRRSVCKI